MTCIVVQVVVITAIILASLYNPILNFGDDVGVLTAYLFIRSRGRGHYAYWKLSNFDTCRSILASERKVMRICNSIQMTLLPNSILNLGIIFAIFLCLITIIVSAFQLNYWHFRLTNVLLLLSGITFFFIGVVWYIVMCVE